MSDVVMRQNDLRPYLDASLNDASTTVDLTGETVRFVLRSSDNEVVADEDTTGAQVVILAATSGRVRYKWLPADTSTAGSYLAACCFYATLFDGDPRAFDMPSVKHKPEDKKKLAAVAYGVAG